MVQYKVAYGNPQERFLQIECLFENLQGSFLEVLLPAWRPGRYELQNYARNIHFFKAKDQNGKPLIVKKTHKNIWKIETNNAQSVLVSYSYYAFQLDAGGSLLNDTQVYINPINCLVYVKDKIDEACSLQLVVPPNYEVACGLPKKSKYLLIAENYHQLVDSPLIASASLKHRTYHVGGIPFHIWIQGDWQPDWEILLADFEKFTKFQIDIFGDFPEQEYHFLCQILPQKFYHGVEHRNSTVICFGASERMNEEENYKEFLSICSHELFHAWNVCKIRPQEMMPYDYSQETYFETGFVAEGLTTYYGELALVRSGVWKYQQFLIEINKILKKYFENFGRYQNSLISSSWDLWLDGYSQNDAAPSRSVSIYHKGAIVAMILDLEIRLKTQNAKSLDDVMRKLWTDFGKTAKGYSLQDFRNVCEEVAQSHLEGYFAHCIEGVADLEDILKNLCQDFAMNLIVNHHNRGAEMFGFQTKQKEGKTWVSLIEPNSNAAKVLSLQDEVIAVDDRKVENNLNELIADKQTVILTIFREKKLYHVVMSVSRESYLKEYNLQIDSSADHQKTANLIAWLG
ncbi:MAG: PDZ domain-containing protein [Raineya sp.]